MFYILQLFATVVTFDRVTLCLFVFVSNLSLCLSFPIPTLTYGSEVDESLLCHIYLSAEHVCLGSPKGQGK